MMATEADRAEVMELRKRIGLLLTAVGEAGECNGPNCRQRVFWLVHRNGRRTPYDADGRNHFIGCTDREMFKKRK